MHRFEAFYRSHKKTIGFVAKFDVFSHLSFFFCIYFCLCFLRRRIRCVHTIRAYILILTTICERKSDRINIIQCARMNFAFVWLGNTGASSTNINMKKNKRFGWYVMTVGYAYAMEGAANLYQYTGICKSSINIIIIIIIYIASTYGHFLFRFEEVTFCQFRVRLRVCLRLGEEVGPALYLFFFYYLWVRSIYRRPSANMTSTAWMHRFSSISYFSFSQTFLIINRNLVFFFFFLSFCYYYCCRWSQWAKGTLNKIKCKWSELSCIIHFNLAVVGPNKKKWTPKIYEYIVCRLSQNPHASSSWDSFLFSDDCCATNNISYNHTLQSLCERLFSILFSFFSCVHTCVFILILFLLLRRLQTPWPLMFTVILCSTP